MAFKVFKGADFVEDLVSVGVHDAVVAEVYDLGYRRSKFRPGEIAHQGVFVCQVDEVHEEGDFAGQRKEIWFFFNPDSGLGPRTNLYKFLTGWRGRDMTEDELNRIGDSSGGEGLDLMTLAGKPLQVVVKHKKGEGANAKLRHYVEATLPANKDQSKWLRIEGYTPIDQREKLNLDTAFGEPVQPEQAAAEQHSQAAATNDPVPF